MTSPTGGGLSSRLTGRQWPVNPSRHSPSLPIRSQQTDSLGTTHSLTHSAMKLILSSLALCLSVLLVSGLDTKGGLKGGSLKGKPGHY